MSGARSFLPAEGERPRIIGEVAQTHEGSLGQAHAFIDVIADAGADAVKFQTHIADAESSPAEPWRIKFSPQDKTRQDYWRRMEFTAEQWAGLKTHAEDRGLTFLSSPFSLEAVDLLEKIGITAWKVASGEVSNLLLLDAILATGKPVLLSSGMSGWGELDRAVERVKRAGNELAVFQCTTAYPCPPEQTGLNVLGVMRSRYQCPVGLSDHSGEIYAGLAAVTLGAALVEVHVTLSPRMFGPDVPCSLTPEDLASLVRGVDAIHRMINAPVDKDEAVTGKENLRITFGQSLCARRDMVAGENLQLADLATRKPGTGVPAAAYESFLGKTLVRSIRRGEFLRWEDIGEQAP